MWVVNNRKIFYAISGILVIGAIVAISLWGLKPSIDFSGGTLINVSYGNNRPEQATIVNVLLPFDENVSVRASNTSSEQGFIIRMRSIDEEQHALVKKALTINDTFQPVEKSFDSIGPVLGEEALRKAYWSIALVVLGIVLFVTFAFRKVSEPVSSWKYGLVAIAALIHDIIIPTGVFALLGHTAGYEVDTLFVTALLVILGFSVHDTIVVFDRVRENLKEGHSSKESFVHIVGKSISQTFTRSINTSLTTLLALVVLYFVGGPSTQQFTLTLIIGIAAGTYSSIFVGSPLLVTIEKLQGNKGKK